MVKRKTQDKRSTTFIGAVIAVGTTISSVITLKKYLAKKKAKKTK